MATKLDKTICRESTDMVMDDRNILVCLTEDQKIEMKPKGMKTTGIVNIGIKELYEKLSGGNETSPTPPTVAEPKKEEIKEPVTVKRTRSEDPEERMLFSLYDFRSKYLVSADFPYEIKTKLEAITVTLINERKNKQ